MLHAHQDSLPELGFTKYSISATHISAQVRITLHDTDTLIKKF